MDQFPYSVEFELYDGTFEWVHYATRRAAVGDAVSYSLPARVFLGENEIEVTAPTWHEFSGL